MESVVCVRSVFEGGFRRTIRPAELTAARMYTQTYVRTLTYSHVVYKHEWSTFTCKHSETLRDVVCLRYAYSTANTNMLVLRCDVMSG